MKSEIHGRLAIDRQGRAVKLIFKNTSGEGVKGKKVQFFAFIFYFRSSTNRFFSALNFLEDLYWDESHEVPIAKKFFEILLSKTKVY